MGRRENKDRTSVLYNTWGEERIASGNWGWFFFLRTTGGGKGPEYHNEIKRYIMVILTFDV